MSVSERERHELYVAFEELIGAERATTMMSMLPPVGWADVATKHDLAALEARIDLRFEALDHRFEVLDHRFEALDHRFEALDPRFESVDHKIDGLEHRLEAKLERSLREQLRVLMFGLVASLVSMTTLNLTAVALLR